MSRRDTIIVAVLINAGLLIVLFASALKSNSCSEDFAVAPVSTFQDVHSLALKKDPVPVMGDEVDLALSQFTQPPVVAAAIQPSANMPMTSPVAASSSFADDLKAIALPEHATTPSATAPTVYTLVAPIAPQPKLASEFVEVKVKKGDVLEKIARYHHSTVAEIMKTNKLTNTNLRIGQVLKIPNKTIGKAEISTIANISSEEGAKYYTVKKGDNPWTIAVKNHLKVEDLLKLNSINQDQARRLKPGDQLRIQ